MNHHFKVATLSHHKKNAIDISRLKIYTPTNILINLRTLHEKYTEYLEEIIMGDSPIELRMEGITEILSIQRDIKRNKTIYIKTSNNFIASLTPISICLNLFFEKHANIISSMGQMIYGLNPDKPIDLDPDMLNQLSCNQL